jgi:hypothetical protein
MWGKWGLGGLFFILVNLVIFQNCGQFLSHNSMSSQSLSLPIINCDSGQDCNELIQQQNTFCFFNGQPVAQGETVLAFMEPRSDRCESEERLCQNGELTGSYNYQSCVGPDQASRSGCSFNGREVKEGESVVAYLDGGLSGEKACQSEVRTCEQGRLTGTYQFSSCSEQAPSCLFNGRTLQDKEYTLAYEQRADGSCTSEFRLCSQGVLSGSFTGSHCIQGQRACQFDGQIILANESVNAYGGYNSIDDDCAHEVRVCQDGVLSGGLRHSQCFRPVSAQACQFAGRRLNSGESVVGFAEPESGSSCELQVRLCEDGALSGDASFRWPFCPSPNKVVCEVSGRFYLEGEAFKSFDYAVIQSNVKNCDDYSTVSRCTGSGEFDIPPASSLACTSQSPQAPMERQGCEFNGANYEHGRGRWFYKQDQVDYASAGYDCISTENSIYLRCEDGVMRPTDYSLRYANIDYTLYPHTSCSIQARSCELNGQTYNHRQLFFAYKQQSLPYSGEARCLSPGFGISGYCMDGQLLDGRRENPVDASEYPLNSCRIVGQSCQFDGVTYNHNAPMFNRYRQSVVNFQGAEPDGRDRSCMQNNNMVSVRCIDGVPSVYSLSTRSYSPYDSSTHPALTCEVNASPCNYDGVDYAHGQIIGKRYQNDLVPYVDHTTHCEQNNNAITMMCLDGDFREWRDESTTITFSGEGGILFVPDPARTVNPADYSHSSCRVDAQACNLDLITVLTRRVSSQSNEFTNYEVSRNYSGLGGSIGTLYREGHRPLASNGERLCLEPSNLRESLRCFNGQVRPGQLTTIRDENGSRTVAIPTGDEVSTEIFKFTNCLDEVNE